MFKAFFFKIVLVLFAMTYTFSVASLVLQANDYYGYVYHDYRIPYEGNGPDSEQVVIKSVWELNEFIATHPYMESIDVSRYTEAYFVQRFLVMDALLEIASGSYRFAVAGVHWNGLRYDINYINVTRSQYITDDMAARLHIIELRRTQMYQ